MPADQKLREMTLGAGGPSDSFESGGFQAQLVVFNHGMFRVRGALPIGGLTIRRDLAGRLRTGFFRNRLLVRQAR